ncbi:2-hydroxyglutaryl-CoA dehydratase activator [Desulfoluna limicola]|uniref:2-hydroxyglutaryl-CoA dehydratase activator n=1 Tax=Desulfoluna limicola TaxID=2810562 RepID=A0ABN6F145_9BACT|nr:acyl-CoA dehydratase activase [Desulfoluna limicola]BCS95211.1 2-hydroxyglutaryl-CoA dehydratase activator [Desulfoluna limicola]
MTLNILGLDIGSVSATAVEMTPCKQIVKKVSLQHKGEMKTAVDTLLGHFSESRIAAVAVTDTTPSLVEASQRYDGRISLIRAVKHFHPEIRTMLSVGGEQFALIRFDEEGNYVDTRGNTSCAAGTGSFLDQQAGRLNLSGIEELSRVAEESNGTFPEIASRCAVFAKTDLIHAQQEGYSLSEICDGLCHGLAKNIADTVFASRKQETPVLFVGGVALNRTVTAHLEALAGVPFVTDELALYYGAVGVALELIDEEGVSPDAVALSMPEGILRQETFTQEYHYPPLELRLSDYPDFASEESYDLPFEQDGLKSFVEVDIYETPEVTVLPVTLGIDIGSTSTKAVVVDAEKRVIAGFYTRTSGRPVGAVSGIFEAAEEVEKRLGVTFEWQGAGTTGSGRKFIGSIVGADLFLDEITAHARAACELNPSVDTIIEIGGQDAKFTTLKDGMVTSSVMNNVCAAGTGSFIEEQALKLGCGVRDYSARTLGVRAPMSSDRCTVFMERDINHYLAGGFSVDDVLASALHSVRENYLIKVADEGRIGDVIFFQGATAKNKALVAAFEQRMGKQILVSKYCHLTGALGTALTLLDEGVPETTFRGTGLHRQTITVTPEVCTLCNNRCKISVADVAGEKVAYGFLCGREYESTSFVNSNTAGFDLLKERRKVYRQERRKSYRHKEVIGIPAALHLHEDLPFWKRFFSALSIETLTSESLKPAVKEGKNLTGAEFCAPMTALHGHVSHLSDKADFVFLPYYIENKNPEKGGRRQYCYYTQFSPAVLSASALKGRARLLTPTLKYIYSGVHTRYQLYRMMKEVTKKPISFFEISTAYNKAQEFMEASEKQLKGVYEGAFAPEENLSVVLLGRPYTVLSPHANNRIPEIFAERGIKSFFQDMLPKGDNAKIRPMLDELHWNYAAKILEAAETAVGTEGLYPVFVTSFKCAPDSFIIDAFKKVMEANNKPYLILELDEHDSSVGYETRIEAALRSFRNHHNRAGGEAAGDYSLVNPELTKEVRDKNVVIPNWDPITCRLLAENLRREGFTTYLIKETPATIQKSLKFNTGQCIPVNAIAQGFIECMEENQLDPAHTVLWMSHSELACNIKLYPHFIKSHLKAHGGGMEKAGVFVGELSFMDISIRAGVNAYFAYLFGGLLRKMICRIRPYEVTVGATDMVAERSIEILCDALAGYRTKESAVIQVTELFSTIKVRREERIKVALFGDLYVRDNDVMNQDLVRVIEAHGGEAITTPYNDYAKMIAEKYFKKWFAEGKYMNVLSYKPLLAAMNTLEKRYLKYFERVLPDVRHTYDDDPEKIIAQYNLSLENTGESMDNILKVHYIKKHYPDVGLFVQTSPAFCCASLITEAMTEKIEGVTGVPVVCVTYDGTGGNKNRQIIPYLKYPRKAEGVDLRKASA